NLWTEYVPSVAKLQYQILPRMFALSELAWAKPEKKDYKDFSEVRLAKHFARLDAMNYNYRVPTAFEVIDTMMIGSQFTMTPTSVVPGAKIYYTLNGRDPLDTDLPYDSLVTFNIPANEKRVFKTVVITPSGRRSLPTSTIMYNEAPISAASYTGNSQGLKFTLIKGSFTSPDQLDYAPTDSAGIAKTLETADFRKTRPNSGIIYEGYISVPADGIYNFSSATYNDTQLLIDDIRMDENQGAINLLKGYHKIKIKTFYNAPVTGFRRKPITALRVFVIAPGSMDKKLLGADMLYN
ncbi:MAG TPA: chitobiase/beta-hexosaminidase C-terminal domain-containing protein, partial [Mucilaginibacter sp.]